MLTTVLTVVATAVLSSVTTLALAAWFLRRRWQAEWRAALDARLAELGDTVRVRVREGVLDAVAALPSPETIRGTTESVVRTATSLVGSTLDTLLGTPPRDR